MTFDRGPNYHAGAPGSRRAGGGRGPSLAVFPGFSPKEVENHSYFGNSSHLAARMRRFCPPEVVLW